MSNPRKQHKRKSARRASRERKTTKEVGPQPPREVSPTSNSHDPLAEFFAPEPGRPILNALRAASSERWNCLREMPSEITEEFQRLASEGRLTDDYVKSRSEEMARFAEEWHELVRWIYPQNAPPSMEKRLEVALLLSTGGFPAEDAAAILRAPKYLTKGRPATRRSITIRAAEMKLADPSLWTWRKLALTFCNCDKKPHDEKCAKNLRRQVLLLNRMLSRLKITVPTATEG